MEIQTTNPRVVATWNFRGLGAFPQDCRSMGCSLQEAGLELCGPGALVTFPVTLPPDIGCLRSRSLAVCVRFIPSDAQQAHSGLIAIGLDNPFRNCHERLVFGFPNSDYRYNRVWRVDRAGVSGSSRFGFGNAPWEFDTNEDIHLVLVVEGAHERGNLRGARFECYRNGVPYGVPVVCSAAAEFRRNEYLDLIIMRPEGPGTVMIAYAHLYGEALAENEVRRLAQPAGEAENQGPQAGPYRLESLSARLPSDKQPGASSHLVESLRSSMAADPQQEDLAERLYNGEYDVGLDNTRHSFVIIWNGRRSDWSEQDAGLLEQALLEGGVHLLAIQGFYSKPAPSSMLIIKGHFLTSEHTLIKEQGLLLLQRVVGDRVKRFEIGEAEADGTSFREVLDAKLCISNIPLLQRVFEHPSGEGAPATPMDTIDANTAELPRGGVAQPMEAEEFWEFECADNDSASIRIVASPKEGNPATPLYISGSDIEELPTGDAAKAMHLTGLGELKRWPVTDSAVSYHDEVFEQKDSNEELSYSKVAELPVGMPAKAMKVLGLREPERRPASNMALSYRKEVFRQNRFEELLREDNSLVDLEILEVMVASQQKELASVMRSRGSFILVCEELLNYVSKTPDPFLISLDDKWATNRWHGVSNKRKRGFFGCCYSHR